MMSASQALLLIQTYSAMFAKDFNVKVNSEFILYQGDESSDVAQCFHDPDRIKISIHHFTTLAPRHQRELVYHELGHCEFGLDHDDQDGGIMQTNGFSTKENYSNWKINIKRMKNDIQKKP